LIPQRLNYDRQKKESEELTNLYLSKIAELAAVYGKRRLENTYLINETFKNKFFF
jgi:AAA+ ATPase superfamily predicted ATPase